MLLFGSVQAELELPDIIADHMVLKQKSMVPLWGTEMPGEKIKVETSWDGREYETVANTKGEWKVMVKTPAGGGPYTIRFTGTSKIVLNDVLVGEVWLSCGQSNMAFRMRQDSQSAAMLPKATNKQIRLFRPARKIAQEETTSYGAKKTDWLVCSPENVREFSAMTYYFAEELQQKLKVPVGVINVSWGGVSIESWLAPSVIFLDEVMKKPVQRWEKWKSDYARDSVKFVADSLAFEVKRVGKKPELPQSVYMMRRPHRQYSVLYNGMVAPCLPYAISGMLWYQGTSSMEWSNEYERQLNELITSWRKAFGHPDMPVIIGQLTAFNYQHEDRAYQLRNAQLNQRKLKNTYVFCTMDHGDLKDIHPTHKQPYGLRFAGLALDKVYHLKGIASMCPSFKEMKRDGNRLIISFNDVEGLHVKGNLDGIYIAGATGDFVKAKAQIVGSQLIVSSDEIEAPIRVHYLYHNTANIPLYNAANLPAFPFYEKLK